MMGVGGVVVVLGLLVSIASYFPASRPARFLSGGIGMPHPDDNLYLYENIAKYEPEEFVRTLEASYLEAAVRERAISRGERDLAALIIHEARIIVCKARLLGYSLLLYAIGAAIVTVAALVALIDQPAEGAVR